MTYTIHATPRSDGIDEARAEWNDQTFTASGRNGASFAVARKLIAAGAPDGPLAIIGPDGWVSFRSTLARWALFTISEPDKGRVKVAIWVPFEREVAA